MFAPTSITTSHELYDTFVKIDRFPFKGTEKINTKIDNLGYIEIPKKTGTAHDGLVRFTGKQT